MMQDQRQEVEGQAIASEASYMEQLIMPRCLKQTVIEFETSSNSSQPKNLGPQSNAKPLKIDLALKQ